MKQYFALLLLIAAALNLSMGQEFNPKYQFLHSGSYVQDKIFYLFTVFEQVPELAEVIKQDPELSRKLSQIKDRIQSALAECEIETDCILEPFYFPAEEQEYIGNLLAGMVDREILLKKAIQQHLRPSGVFIKHAHEPDGELLRRSWLDACKGLAFILDTYGKGKKGRYPNIDSLGYDASGFYYQRVVRTVAFSVENDSDRQQFFFQPALQMAMTLLDINYRDEAGRHEPMHQLENRKAYEYIPTINWDDYPYACILQPGHGPEKEGIALSPLGKMRVKLVAERFHQGWAPLIILSGGYVHPFQTPFAEALEMKKALIETYGVPERAIIIEPHARHTTTNFRNAARLMFRYGIPTDKMSVCTSTFDQITYITDPVWKFKERNLNELGYLPYQLFEKVSRNDVEFKPLLQSLYVDATDPLDP